MIFARAMPSPLPCVPRVGPPRGLAIRLTQTAEMLYRTHYERNYNSCEPSLHPFYTWIVK
jgi:hypothetical protein